LKSDLDYIKLTRFVHCNMKKLIAKFLNILGLKQLAFIFVKKIKLYYRLNIRDLFNSYIISQRINYKSIPIIIISFNQLCFLKQLIDFLRKCKYTNIIVIDNNSTYEPLLDYFDTIESSVTLYRLKENYGHLVFWKNMELYKKYSKGYYVVTDPDIVPVENCPEDFVLHFKRILDKNLHVTKVGFSLKMDDIPDSNPNKQKVIDWESQFWLNKTDEGNFISPIDTTFALYRPNYEHKHSTFYDAIRIKWPYQAIHGGWYLDIENLTEEQSFYFATCNDSSSWRIGIAGEIIDEIYLN
jgi:hypothetical protein